MEKSISAFISDYFFRRQSGIAITNRGENIKECIFKTDT